MALRRNSLTLAALCLAVLSCRAQSDRSQHTENAEVRSPQETPVLPVAEPPLDREALLIAAIRAASAHAGGTDDSGLQRGLDGKRFEMRFRFGCPGSKPDADAPFQSTYDPVERRVVLRAAPDVTREDPALSGIAGDEVEALEGFWVRRPWLLRVACVAPPEPERADPATEDAGTMAVEPPQGRVAMAQFFTAADPRTRRRDERPYQFTARLAEGQQPSAAGYDLVISGRLRRLGSGKVVTCTGPAVTTAPTCVISVVVDHVTMNRGDTDAVLAEWGAV